MKTKMKKALAILLTVVTLTTLCSCSIGSERIDMSKYITVTFEGFNGYGNACLEYDLSSLEDVADMESFEKFLEKLGSKDDMEAAWIIAQTDSLKDVFDVALKENSTNLSNGDKVVVEITVDKSYADLGVTMKDLEKALKISIKETKLEYTVEGLEDAKVFDISAHIKDFVKFKGEVSGEITAEIEVPEDFSVKIDDMYLVKGFYTNSVDVIYNNENLGSFTFHLYLDEEEYAFYPTTLYSLSNGDTINVKVTNETNLSDYDYIVETGSAKITTPDFPVIVESKDELTTAQISEVETSINQYISENLSNGSLDSMYFYSIKPTSANTYKCGVVAIAYGEGTFGRSGYKVINVIVAIDNSGNVVTANAYSAPTYGGFYASIDDAYNNGFDHNNYTFEKI